MGSSQPEVSRTVDRRGQTQAGYWHQTGSTHISSNPVNDRQGDTATVESDFQVGNGDTAGRARIVLFGRYRDELRRGPDRKGRLYARTGVSVGHPSEEHTDSEWRNGLRRRHVRVRANLRT